jgi:triosephosphate isomerase
VADGTLVGVSLKMYLGFAETREWLLAVAELSREGDHVELFVAPGFVSLADAAEVLADTSVRLAAQDVFWEDRGAFTGEVSPQTLLDVGCTFVEVGHAERRAIFGEDDAITARKAAAAARSGLVPVICVGEPEWAEPSAAAVACREQLEPVLRAVPNNAEIVCAYEPVWAIGAPTPAPPDHVVAVCRRLRGLLERRPGRTRLIYGGAAGPGLAAALGHAVDGLFLGRFAHDVGNLRTVLQEVAAVAHPAAGTRRR